MDGEQPERTRRRECQTCGRQFVPRPDLRAGRYCSRPCYIKCQPEKFSVEREELERLVWQMPSMEVARKFGVSDSAIVKRCKKLGISKPPRGYWNRLQVGKIDAAGNLTIPMIDCACGCGQRVPKWSGKLLRRRRCCVGHNVRHAGGRPSGRRSVDINVVSLMSFQAAALDDVTTAAYDLSLRASYKYFCEYVGPVWMAIAQAVSEGASADSLPLVAQAAIKNYWREVRGRRQALSADYLRSEFGLETAIYSSDEDDGEHMDGERGHSAWT